MPPAPGSAVSPRFRPRNPPRPLPGGQQSALTVPPVIWHHGGHGKKQGQGARSGQPTAPPSTSSHARGVAASPPEPPAIRNGRPRRRACRRPRRPPCPPAEGSSPGGARPRRTLRVVYQRCSELEKREFGRQLGNSSIALSASRPDLFARQGAVVAAWRRREGRRFGPYYHLKFREDGSTAARARAARGAARC